MSLQETFAIVLVLMGCMVALIASVGLNRFPDVLSRMHAASKPQTFGLILIGLGIALAWWTPAAFGYVALVVLAQMCTVPISSTMLARAAFRRGFVRGGDYAVDELTPRLSVGRGDDDDDDGFIDEDVLAEGEEKIRDAPERFPDNPVGAQLRHADLSGVSNWDEPEPEAPVRREDLDVEEEAIRAPEEAPPPATRPARGLRRSRRR